MSNSGVKVRFDGPILESHSMDVSDLAPALLAIADLCKNANKTFNGDRAAVRVLVNADLKQNCFELYLELAVSIFEQARQFVSHDKVVDAKEILEWLGLIVGAPAAAFGLLRLVQSIGEKRIEKAEIDKDGDVVVLRVTGDNNQVTLIYASPQAYELAKNPANVAAVKRMVEPLSKPGYDSLEFDRGADGIESVSREDARQILKADSGAISDALDDKEEPQVVTAWIKVYAPVYELDAKRWRFTIDGHHHYMDVSDTNIPEIAMARGGALVDDTYKVRLQMVQSKTSTNIAYKILEVLEFHPANLHSQMELTQRNEEPERGG